MKIEITDEMCRRAYLATVQANGAPAIRAALEAVAPIIADQVLERAAQEYARRPDVAIAIRALKEPTP